jgi:hypothetical protein
VILRAALVGLGLGLLLFVARFVLQGHLAPQVDQECHIGGIALELLAHGLRYPAIVYSANDYDNASLVSGALVALGFAALGPSVLVLKLATHAFVTVAALASLSLLCACLDELGVTERGRRALAVAALLVSLALAPRIVTMSSMYGVGNHAEGAAIGLGLVALFVARARRLAASQSPAALGAVLLWAAVGLGVYVNKGVAVVLPVLVAVEVVGSRARPRRLLAAVGGLALGLLPELWANVGRAGQGWAMIAGKAESGSRHFPEGLASSLASSVDHPELLLVWGLALAAGIAWAARRRGTALASVVGVSLTHLCAMAFMAQGGPDAYVLYGHAPIVILTSLLVAEAARHRLPGAGARGTLALGALSLAGLIFAHRPAALRFDGEALRAMAHDRDGAACGWRFAEGFGRAHDHGLVPPGRTREEHVLAGCRSLSDDALRISCVGGIARELQWRRRGRVPGAPPPTLDARERAEYAFWYGTNRTGDASGCRDFDEPALRAICENAVRLDCLVFGDLYTRVLSGHRSGRPACELAEPPARGYWSSARAHLLERADGPAPELSAEEGDADLRGCAAIFGECYGERAMLPGASPHQSVYTSGAVVWPTAITSASSPSTTTSGTIQ